MNISKKLLFLAVIAFMPVISQAREMRHETRRHCPVHCQRNRHWHNNSWFSYPAEKYWGNYGFYEYPVMQAPIYVDRNGFYIQEPQAIYTPMAYNPVVQEIPVVQKTVVCRQPVPISSRCVREPHPAEIIGNVFGNFFQAIGTFMD